jgi:hypothetical protein
MVTGLFIGAPSPRMVKITSKLITTGRKTVRKRLGTYPRNYWGIFKKLRLLNVQSKKFCFF